MIHEKETLELNNKNYEVYPIEEIVIGKDNNGRKLFNETDIYYWCPKIGFYVKRDTISIN